LDICCFAAERYPFIGVIKMPSADTTNLQQLTFEGVLSPWSAIGCAAVAIAVTTWFLWRDRQILGMRLLATFWVLRVVAAIVVVWLLLGPSWQSVDRQVTPQTIALIVDKSPSMGVADSVNSIGALRWRLVGGEDQESVVARLDRAVAALAVARKYGHQAADAVATHAPLESVRQNVDLAEQTAMRASRGLQSAVAELSTRNTELADRAAQICMLVEGPIKKAAKSLVAELDRRDQANIDALSQQSQSLLDNLGGTQRRAAALATDVADRWKASAIVPISMQTPATRLDRVEAAIGVLRQGPFKAYAEKCIIQQFDFTDVVTLFDGKRPGDRSISSAGETNLSAALEAVVGLRRSATSPLVLVFTDGRHNAPSAIPPQDIAAKLSDQPVFFVPLGEAERPRDVAFHRAEAPITVAQHDTVNIEALVTATDCRDEEMCVILRKDAKVIERKTITIDRNHMDVKTAFRVRADELGWQRYDLELEPLNNEASLTNNYSSVSFEVVRDKIRVLLADRSPRWEYRYLLQLFRRDKHILFDDLLFLPKLRGTGRLEKTKRLPQSADDWAHYDVVILGDLSPLQLNSAAQESLVEYITERSGNVVFIAGQGHMPANYVSQPLMELVPVEHVGAQNLETGFTLSLPDSAQFESTVLVRDSFAESQSAWQMATRLAPVFGLSEYSRAKPGTTTLIEALPAAAPATGISSDAPRAFFCWRQIGAGRVAYLAAPQTYLLRFLRGDRDHHRFWGQTLRWLTAAQSGSTSNLVRIMTDRPLYERGQSVEVIAWLKDKRGKPVADGDVWVEARAQNNLISQMQLTSDTTVKGRYSGTFESLPNGQFEIVPTGKLIDELRALTTVAVPRALIVVQSSGNIEMSNTQANLPLLEELADLTGGQVLPPTAVKEILELASLEPQVVEVTQHQPLWNRWLYLFVILGCLFFEWVVRKSKGLT
jgi:hypothetical protein